MFKVLRPVDIVCVGIVTMAASSGVSASLGLTEAPAIIALTMGLACPAARRLIAWRRGAAALRPGTGSDSPSRALVACAMLPWMFLPVLHNLPWQALASVTVARVGMPLALQWAGVALTLFGVLKPMMETFRGTGRIRSSAYLETVGLFLATGSAFLGVLAVCWLVVRMAGNMPLAVSTGFTPQVHPACS